jgi:hypothetical protein
MSKEMTVIVLGLWVAVLPYLGIPGDWRTILLLLSGLGIAVIGFLLRGEALSHGTRPHERNSFVESGQPAQAGQPHPAMPYENARKEEGINSLN